MWIKWIRIRNTDLKDTRGVIVGYPEYCTDICVHRHFTTFLVFSFLCQLYGQEGPKTFRVGSGTFKDFYSFSNECNVCIQERIGKIKSMN
jgi:hypothetical protein